LRQDRGVITGYNTDIKHGDRVFHVQTEDKGVDNPVIESLVYTGGKIIASRQYSYASLLREGYTEKVLQDLLDSQHRKMMRDVRGGKYDQGGPPAFGQGIITERSFDDIVLEFIRGQAAVEGLELSVGDLPAVHPGSLLVLDLSVRGALVRGPVAGAEVVVRGSVPGTDRAVTLFEGRTDEAGRVKAGVEIPRDFAGAKVTIAATAPQGTDEVTLEVRET
jgi:hypothetical protein